MSKLLISSTPSCIVSETTRELLAKIISPLGLHLHDVVRFVIFDDELTIKTATDRYTFSKDDNAPSQFIITHGPAFACTEVDKEIDSAIVRMQQIFDSTF